MPIDDNGQGWNKSTTLEKQRVFSAFALFHMTWAEKVMRKHDFFDRWYRYYDLTAGVGCSDQYGDGSPLLHAKAAAAYRAKSEKAFRVKARLVEIQPESSNRLEALAVINQDLMLSPDYYAEVYCADHNAIVREWINEWWARRDKLPYTGLVYLDPNGQVPPFDLLRELNDAHPRMDILIHLSATNMKRVRGAFGGDDLIESLRRVGKRHWKVAKLPSTAHQWTFVFGTNYDGLGDWKRMNLFSIDSQKGNDVLIQLNYTVKEIASLTRTGQMPLWK